MSLVRIAAIALGTFCMIGSTLAKPEPGAEAEVKPAPAPDPAAARAGGGGVVHRGGGGVGFSAPRRDEQLAVMKLVLEINDEAWAKISPKVEKVLTAKLNTNTGVGMQWTASDRAKPTYQASSSRPDTAPGRALQEVRDAIAAPAPSDEQLTRTMAAVREARQKARADYEAAQKELIEVITPHQQATLMVLGLIE